MQMRLSARGLSILTTGRNASPCLCKAPRLSEQQVVKTVPGQNQAEEAKQGISLVKFKGI